MLLCRGVAREISTRPGCGTSGEKSSPSTLLKLADVTWPTQSTAHSLSQTPGSDSEVRRKATGEDSRKRLRCSSPVALSHSSPRPRSSPTAGSSCCPWLEQDNASASGVIGRGRASSLRTGKGCELQACTGMDRVVNAGGETGRRWLCHMRH